jgi:hypothetical protein
LRELDKVDPLRLALREPTNQLVERIADIAWTFPDSSGPRARPDMRQKVVRSVLDAFAKAVTPDGR